MCWLYGSGRDREHDDIDLFSFAPHDPHPRRPDSALTVMRLAPEGLSDDSSVNGPDIEIITGSYFHAEISPSARDIREVVLNGTPLPVLSPEFLLISKLSYPSSHRIRDIQDVIALNSNRSTRRADDVERLLQGTSLAAFTDAGTILRMRTWDDFRDFVLRLQARLTGTFLRCSWFDVEQLEPLHLFTLLDVSPDDIDLPQGIRGSVDDLLGLMAPGLDRLQLARLGFHLILSEVPDAARATLMRSLRLEQIACHLAFKNPAYWLGNAKTVCLVLRELTAMERALGKPGAWSSEPEIIMNIVDRVFFRDPSVFTLLAAARMLHQDVVHPGFAADDIWDALGPETGTTAPQAPPRPSDYAAFPWIFARRRSGYYPAHTERGGKWIFSIPERDADNTWRKVAEEIERGRLGTLVKITTAYVPPGRPRQEGSRTVCVYTYDSRDEQDKNRIGSALRSLGVPTEMHYQTDLESSTGVNAKP